MSWREQFEKKKHFVFLYLRFIKSRRAKYTGEKQ